ncbi:hypothetical protein BT93_C0336 [Corymbia citriodora subsp. variegata]|nr:hypothetical protein BT93_C0336 [Corymbia citriodora subsp. variegata]
MAQRSPGHDGAPTPGESPRARPHRMVFSRFYDHHSRPDGQMLDDVHRGRVPCRPASSPEEERAGTIFGSPSAVGLYEFFGSRVLCGSSVTHKVIFMTYRNDRAKPRRHSV